MELQFLGATQEVTGSCFLITTQHHRLLVDCGLIQGSPQEEKRNAKPFPFKANKIDAVLLTHAHIDHSGRLPYLIKQGFQGKIYTHSATRDLCSIMLKDAAFIYEKDLELDNRKRARKGLPLLEPLYDITDVERTLTHIQGLEYGQLIEFLPGFKMRLNDAGHILGSAIIELFVNEKGNARKLVFSGDLGRKNMPILKDPTSLKEADFVIMESTYGDRLLPTWQENLEAFSQIISDALKTKGNILIPSFAVGRAQELLYLFKEQYDSLPIQNTLIFLDSPMAIEATKVYSKHWMLYDQETKHFIETHGSPYELPNLRLCVKSEDSMAINNISQGAVVIAGSGMCDGGRIRHHLKHNIWRKQCHVVFVGYQAYGTLGREILEGAKHIKLWGERIKVAAQIHHINGFSAHADQEALIHWYGCFQNRPPVCLIHGEKKAQQELQKHLSEKYTIHPWIPGYRDKIDLISKKFMPHSKREHDQ